MLDFSTVVSASQLLNTAVGIATKARDLAKDSSDSKLKDEINSLYGALLDIKAKVLDLDEENRSLKSQLTTKEAVEGPISPHGYFRYKDKPDNPLCPKCFMKDEKPVYLPDASQMASGLGRQCIVCHYLKIEVRKAQVASQNTPSWW